MSACPHQGESEGGLANLIAPTVRWVHYDGDAVVDEELALSSQQLLGICGSALVTAPVDEGKPTGALALVTDVLRDPSGESLGATFEEDFWPWVPAVHTSGTLDDTPGVDCVLRLQQSASIVVVMNPETAPEVGLSIDDHFGFGSIATANRDSDARLEVVLSGLNGDFYTVDWEGTVDLSTTRLIPEVGDEGYCLTATAAATLGIIAAGEACSSRSTDGIPNLPDRLFLLTTDLEVTASVETELEHIQSLLVVEDQLYVVGYGFEPSPDSEGNVQTHIAPADLSSPLAPFLEGDLRAIADLDGDGSKEPAVVRQVAGNVLPPGTIDVRGHEDEVVGPFVTDLDEDGREDLIYGLINLYSEF